MPHLRRRDSNAEGEDEDTASNKLLHKERNKIQYTIRKGLRVDQFQARANKRKSNIYKTAHRIHKTADAHLAMAARWTEEQERLHEVKAHIRDTSILVDNEEWDGLIGRGVTKLIIEDVDNSMRCIPVEVSNIQTLRSFSVIWSQVKLLPQHVFLMPLTELSIAKCPLKSIDGIQVMENLEKLEVTNTQLVKVPLEIGEMARLKSLDLTGNKLKVVPASIGNLQKLESLKVCGNKLTALPASVTSLVNLHSLDASQNHIKELPDQIGQLVNLVSLRMSHNSISVLPDSTRRLASLRNLFLSDNMFTDVPRVLAYNSELITLNMNGNHIQEVSTALPHLKTLLLDKNAIEDMNGPLLGCLNLEKLSLQFNRLTTVPPEIKKLQKLRALYLGGNDIASLPDEICELKELRHLVMKETQIQELPLYFDQLRKLSVVDIDSTKLNLQYLHALRSNGIDGLREHVRMRRRSSGDRSKIVSMWPDGVELPSNISSTVEPDGPAIGSRNSSDDDDEEEEEEEEEEVSMVLTSQPVVQRRPDGAGSERDRSKIVSMWPNGVELPSNIASYPHIAAPGSRQNRREVQSMFPDAEPEEFELDDKEAELPQHKVVLMRNQSSVDEDDRQQETELVANGGARRSGTPEADYSDDDDDDDGRNATRTSTKSPRDSDSSLESIPDDLTSPLMSNGILRNTPRPAVTAPKPKVAAKPRPDSTATGAVIGGGQRPPVARKPAAVRIMSGIAE